MAVNLEIAPAGALARIQRIQWITIGWMTVEALVALATAWRAHSPSLLAFGGDSAVELLSAVVVLWRFRSAGATEADERRAARIAGVLLSLLAAYVLIVAVMNLLGHGEARPSYVGILLLAAAGIVMPWLAREKRRLSAVTGSSALRADAAESALCAYLAWIALAGLGLRAVWNLTWADPVAALLITPLIAWEAREAIRGKACGCC